MAVQRGMSLRNANSPEHQHIWFRIGLNLSNVIVDEDNDIHGDGVNVAARLESIANPGGICVSRRVHEQVQSRLESEFEYLGEQALKNIARPVQVYRAVLDTPTAPRLTVLPLPEKPSIAVLPFGDVNGDPQEEHFGDVIAEDITTALSKSRGLFVIARNSAFSYRGANIDVKTVGRELGVRYLLDGSLRRAGDRVRITARLVETSTGNQL